MTSDYESDERDGGASYRGGGDRDSQNNTRVYIGSILDSVQKEDLESKFSRYGKLVSVWVARNPPGFAFIEYEDSKDADAAVEEMNGQMFMGSKIRVEISPNKGRGGRGRGGRGGGGGRGRGGDRGGFRGGDRRGGGGGFRGGFRGGRGDSRNRSGGGFDGGYRNDRSRSRVEDQGSSPSRGYGMKDRDGGFRSGGGGGGSRESRDVNRRPYRGGRGGASPDYGY